MHHVAAVVDQVEAVLVVAARPHQQRGPEGHHGEGCHRQHPLVVEGREPRQHQAGAHEGEGGALPGQCGALLLQPTRSPPVVRMEVGAVDHGVSTTRSTAPATANRAVPTAMSMGSREA